MRILLALAVVAVFAALFVLDTTALVRLTVTCVVGGCGVPMVWFVIGGSVLALAAVLSYRRPGATIKKPGAKKVGRSRPARGKAIARKKPKQVK
jgi:hypothetical protein